jgi:transposase
LFLLWQEYKEATPAGCQYRWFCQGYRVWAATLDLVMRQSHRAGEQLCVDDAGQSVPVVDADSGERREAALFIAVLGASNYPSVEATWTQSLPDWIASHVRALTALGGVPEVLVPDHLKAAVTRTHRYEPELHRTSVEFAQHYGCMIMPARAGKPRDKAKVEVGVQIVERWILARLRHHTCCTLEEVHTAIAPLLPALNARPLKKLPGSRHSVFEALDRPALRPLPAQPSEYAEWKLVRVNIDSHVDGDGHYDAVPSALVKQQLEVRLSGQGVEIFHQGQRVASHQRSPYTGRHSTVAAHMPTARRRSGGRNDSRLAAPSPTRLPVVLRDDALGQKLRGRAARSGMSTGARRWGLLLSELGIDPEKWSRPAPVASGRRDPLGPRPCAYPRTAVLCRGQYHRHTRRRLMFQHPTLDTLQTLRLQGMYHA